MNICKDCKYYVKGHESDGGTVAPGFYIKIEAMCDHPESSELTIDIVDGNHRNARRECREMRSDEQKCGKHGYKFLAKFKEEV